MKKRILVPNEIHKYFIRNLHKKNLRILTAEINEMFHTDYTYRQLKTYKEQNKLHSGINTQFQHQQIPEKHLPVLSEVKAKGGYIKVKIAEPNIWKLKQVFIYESSHGKIDKDSCVIFLDGNKRNFSPENLAEVSRGECLVMNRYHLRYKNAEFTKTGIIIAKIVRERKRKLSIYSSNTNAKEITKS